MPSVSCIVCNKEFYAKPNHLKLGWGKHCSLYCRNITMKKGRLVNCYTCNKEIYKSLYHLNHSKSKNYFCDKSCQTRWRNSLYTGKGHKNWKGGVKSYREILNRNGQKPICTVCRTEDIRILAVHHKDVNRQNNDITNLIWLCHNCHFLVHHDKKVNKEFKTLDV